MLAPDHVLCNRPPRGARQAWAALVVACCAVATVLGACSGGTEPSSRVQGTYALATLDGAPLPAMWQTTSLGTTVLTALTLQLGPDNAALVRVTTVYTPVGQLADPPVTLNGNASYTITGGASITLAGALQGAGTIHGTSLTVTGSDGHVYAFTTVSP